MENLKYLLIFILIVGMMFSTGCLVTPEESVPEPELVLSVDVDVTEWNENCIWYTIENNGDLDVHYYKLAFDVKFYPGNHTPMTLYEDSLGIFKVGDKVAKCIKIVCPYVEDPTTCPYYGKYKVLSVEVNVIDLW